jgi:hypothetical protein
MTDFSASIPHTFNIWVQKYKKEMKKQEREAKTSLSCRDYWTIKMMSKGNQR